MQFKTYESILCENIHTNIVEGSEYQTPSQPVRFKEQRGNTLVGLLPILERVLGRDDPDLSIALLNLNRSSLNRSLSRLSLSQLSLAFSMVF